MSSAGLVRYFDDEDQSLAISVDPKTMLAFSLFLGFLIEVAHAVAY